MALSGAEAGRGSRLRLTRKKPPAPRSSSCSGPGGGGQEGRTSNNRSWLDQEGLNESDELWKLLVLRSVNSSLHQASQEMPDLPAFFDQSARHNENSQQPALFKVGTEEFQWTPFPPAFAFAGQLKNPDSSHFTKEKPTQILYEQEQRVDQSGGPSCQGASALGRENLEPRPDGGAGVKRPSEWRDSSIGASKSGLPQHAPLSQLRKKQRLWVEGDTSSPASPQTLTLEVSHPGRSPLKKPSRSLCSEGARVEKDATSAAVSQGIVVLDGCPMCQVPFTGKFSQLDIDSHLAKCLSESIEDVIW
ncbi:Fanconi anemia core complex-associated protein 20 [Vombatus ursinus]|uniref:Fanconi anemia core complex-associated protein 20 n=1 Tax=Vombatus ursinus TaxID=29139 RepID=UPI000FFCE702|nr:Fanconi anemia core complex-associated protein 20 [Vombatus ursinus]